MIRSVRFILLLLMVPAAISAQAPVPIALQFGVGAEVPLGEFADVAENGTGFSLASGFQLVPNVALYAGYSRATFGSDAYGGDLTDSGFSAGFSIVIPGVAPRIFPWLGAGGVLHGLRIDGADPQPDRWNPGVGLGSGILFVLHPNVRISPTLGYLQYNTPIPARESLTVTYTSVGLTVNLGL